MVAVEELLPGFASGVKALTVAVLLTTVAFATEALTDAVITLVTDAPDATEEKLMDRLLPEPPQVPLELQETKVTSAGRLSVTVTEVATGPLLLVTVIRYVKLAPGAS